MKELPYIEEIYDFETEQLDSLFSELEKILLAIAGGSLAQIEIPKGFELSDPDRLERKVLKLKESVELELEERRQVDDVISFFVN